MAKRLWIWITTRRFVIWLSWRQATIYQRIEELEAAIQRTLEVLNRRQRELEATHSRAQDALAAATTIAERHRSELQEARERLRIAESVTIPQLVNSHELVLQRTKAEIAANVRFATTSMSEPRK